MLKQIGASVILGCLISLLLSCGGSQTRGGANDQAKNDERIQKSMNVLNTLTSSVDKGIPKAVLDSCFGIAVIPGVVKTSFIIGGHYGTGVMTVRNTTGKWTNPSFIDLKGASIGWQWGVESVDLVMIFKNRHSIESAANGQLILGTDASVAAGPVGRSAGASTNEQLNAEVLTYARSKGAYVGATLNGISININDGANAAFYKTQNISAQSIFQDKITYTPPLATKFVHQVDTLTSHH